MGKRVYIGKRNAIQLRSCPKVSTKKLGLFPALFRRLRNSQPIPMSQFTGNPGIWGLFLPGVTAVLSKDFWTENTASVIAIKRYFSKRLKSVIHVIYCRVPEGWGLQQTASPPSRDEMY